MSRVPREHPLTKAEFHRRLREWFQTTEEPTVGSENVDGRTSWVFVGDGTNLFVLHADTPRRAVEWYLEQVATHGNDLAWAIVSSQRGKMSAVAYGPPRQRITAFYLYCA